jgi:hypothetical protein
VIIRPIERRGLQEVLTLTVVVVVFGAISFVEIMKGLPIDPTILSVLGGSGVALLARTIKNARDREGAAAMAAKAMPPKEPPSEPMAPTK